MEKEEIDDVVAAAQEKEDMRIKKRETSETKEKIASLASLAMQTPPGKRAKTIKEARKESGRWV